MNTSIVIKQETVDSDIATICSGIRPDEWDTDNEMESYDETALHEYLSHEDNILLVAYDTDEIVGLLLATKIYLPYARGRSNWMYVDELDTKPSHRRRGIARSLMQRIIEIARDRGMSEVYVATERDNTNARVFYESLHPAETEPAIGYTYKTDRTT